MSISKPYHLTVRQFKAGDYCYAGNSGYIQHRDYAANPSRYMRAFQLIQKDLLTLFEYIEPAEQNKECYALRTFELLLRICTEVEANFKSILRANTFTSSSPRGPNMCDYFRVSTTHFLSEYEILLPHWEGSSAIRTPFSAWSTGTYAQLPWYGAYNDAKHDRAENLKEATLGNVITSFCGLGVLLASQFYIFDFSSNDGMSMTHNLMEDFEASAGSYLWIKFPQNTPIADRYDFDWKTLETLTNPFEKFDYDSI